VSGRNSGPGRPLGLHYDHDGHLLHRPGIAAVLALEKKAEPTVGQAFPTNQNVFRWTFSNTAPPDPSLGDYAACGDPLDTIVLVPFCLLSPLVCAGLARWERGCAPKGLACFPFAPDLPPATLTFEGPTEDDFADPLKPWKNAFTPGAFRLITPKLP
jgi:hypothetical protein